MIGVFAIDLTSYIDKTKERLKNKLGKLQKRGFTSFFLWKN